MFIHTNLRSQKIESRHRRGEDLHLWSGVKKEERGKAGLLILIKKKWKNSVRHWESVHEIINKIDLNMYGQIII